MSSSYPVYGIHSSYHKSAFSEQTISRTSHTNYLPFPAANQHDAWIYSNMQRTNLQSSYVYTRNAWFIHSDPRPLGFCLNEHVTLSIKKACVLMWWSGIRLQSARVHPDSPCFDRTVEIGIVQRRANQSLKQRVFYGNATDFVLRTLFRDL
jgi:hypothetical protein